MNYLWNSHIGFTNITVLLDVKNQMSVTTNQYLEKIEKAIVSSQFILSLSVSNRIHCFSLKKLQFVKFVEMANAIMNSVLKKSLELLPSKLFLKNGAALFHTRYFIRNIIGICSFPSVNVMLCNLLGYIYHLGQLQNNC